MSLNKRVKGNYLIETIEDGNTITIRAPGIGGVIIDGDLTITGNQNTVVETQIVDKTITLNSGQTGDGVSGSGVSGIVIDRGPTPAGGDAGIRFEEASNQWKINNGDGLGYVPIAAGASGINNVVEDLSPQLGADLDVNGFSITSAAAGDIVIVADTTGLVKLDQDLSLKEQVGDETPLVGYNKLYAKAVGSGGSGLFFSNLSETDELVSKKKAIVYGIIF